MLENCTLCCQRHREKCDDDLAKIKKKERKKGKKTMNFKIGETNTCNQYI